MLNLSERNLGYLCVYTVLLIQSAVKLGLEKNWHNVNNASLLIHKTTTWNLEFKLKRINKKHRCGHVSEENNNVA